MKVRRRRAVEPLADDALAAPQRDHAAWDALEHCAGALTAREREVFERRYVRGLSLAEIAAELGSNANAVAQSVFRLSRKMRDCLQGQGYAVHGRREAPGEEGERE